MSLAALTAKILSRVGEVSYSRACAKGPVGRRSFPADKALGITRGCTLAAAKLLCHEAARSQSYLQASENLALASGLAVSPKCRQIKCGTLFLMERDGEGRYRSRKEPLTKRLRRKHKLLL